LNKYQILLVEDDSTLLQTVAYNLERQGYQVHTATTGWEAVQKAQSLETLDLVLLDIMLPELDGFEVCRIIRQDRATPIIMLTARSDEVDKVVGLEVGADDYVTKPFSMRELMARVKAMLRRVRLVREEMESDSAGEEDELVPGPREILTSGNLSINIQRREVLLDNEVLPLRPREFDLLLFLVRNRGTVLSRDLILERVWGWDYGGGTRTVDVHVRWLREKIESDSSTPGRIVTIRGIGYRFEG
jgi:DNA-binding response OmpR family regulator